MPDTTTALPGETGALYFVAGDRTGTPGNHHVSIALRQDLPTMGMERLRPAAWRPLSLNRIIFDVKAEPRRAELWESQTHPAMWNKAGWHYLRHDERCLWCAARVHDVARIEPSV